jgi:hypothetical protein
MQQLAKRLSQAFFVLFLGLFGNVGCSGDGKLNAVKGKVTYKGEALAGALVSFHPKGKTDLQTEVSTGFTKEDGTFEVKTGQKDGAVAGDYVVTIICITTAPAKEGKKTISMDMGGPDNTYDRLQGKYANKDTSTISATIKAGENQLEPFVLN